MERAVTSNTRMVTAPKTFLIWMRQENSTVRYQASPFLKQQSSAEVANNPRRGLHVCSLLMPQGGKEKPIVIGKSANPRCLKGIKDLSNLPCTYFHQKKGLDGFRYPGPSLDKTESEVSA